MQNMKYIYKTDSHESVYMYRSPSYLLPSLVLRLETRELPPVNDFPTQYIVDNKLQILEEKMNECPLEFAYFPIPQKWNRSFRSV